jgi:hypothetical protein
MGIHSEKTMEGGGGVGGGMTRTYLPGGDRRGKEV